MLRGSRQAQRERRAQAYAEQAERVTRTGFAGGHAELGHAVAYELRRLGYSPAIAAYGGHLCAVGGAWNFQGNPRLASLVGRCLRSAQRYRAQLEADGLLRSYCLEPGDMIDGQRAPVSRPQVVRDLSQLRALALARLARPAPKPHRRSKAQARAAARAAAVIAPPRAAPLSAEQLQDVVQHAPEWLRGAILGTSAGATGAASAARAPRPCPVAVAGRNGSGRYDGQRWSDQRHQQGSTDLAELTDAELDDLDAELRELTERRDRERSRPPPPD